TMNPMAATPAEGLALDPQQFIRPTAVNLVAHGANTGAQALPSDPTLLFGENMPNIDGNGNVSNSLLMYKVLLAIPQAPPVDAGSGAAPVEEAGSTDAGIADATVDAEPTDAALMEAGLEDAGTADAGSPAPVKPPAPLDVTQVYAPFQITDMSPAERAILNNYIEGLPMPIVNPKFPTGITGPMTLNELELVSLWISQGTPVPASCPPGH